ncbi:hypothetical protein V8E54_013210 [Elaphomyces granulatus]
MSHEPSTTTRNPGKQAISEKPSELTILEPSPAPAAFLEEYDRENVRKSGRCQRCLRRLGERLFYYMYS